MSGGDVRRDILALTLDAGREFVERYDQPDDAVEEVMETASALIGSLAAMVAAIRPPSSAPR